MTMTARDGYFVPRGGAVAAARDVRPLAAALVGSLFFVVVFLLFSVSSGMVGAIGYRFFPFRFEGVELEWDMRSTGLSGHPLENAQLTSIYIMALLAGGGMSMPPALRPAAVLLQLAALVPFGGRTAMLLTLAMI